MRDRSSSLELLFAKIMKKDEVITMVADSESCVFPISDTLYNQMGEPNQKRMHNKNIIGINDVKMPAKGSTAIQSNLRNLHLK